MHTSKINQPQSKPIPILHYEVTGSGPTLVLLHGFLLSSRYWQNLAEQLSGSYRVVALDLLGFGSSPKPFNSSYDYAAQLYSINATLAKLGIDSPFTLIGHSMGALIALRFARQYPQQVKRLFLANMPLLLSRQEARQDIMGTNLAYRLGLTPVTQRIIWPIFYLSITLRLLPGSLGRELRARASYMFQHTARSRLRSFRNVILSASIEADLQAIRVKTTIITGLGDRLLYLQNLPRLLLNANVTSEILEGGHHLVLTKPEYFIRLLRYS